MRFLVASLFFLPWSFSQLFGEVSAFSEEEIAFFRDEVKPILQGNCFKCHGGEDEAGKVKIRSEFQAISRRGIVQGGALGPAYDESDPENSLLLHMISYKDDEHEMPPSGKLSDQDIATVTKWVKMGMPWTPEDADVLHDLHEGEGEVVTEINAFTQSYWSYKPLKRPTVPTVDDPAWNAHPIDAFIYAKLKENGLSPNAAASPRALVRRAFHNVTGLPPTPEEVEKEAGKFSESSWLDLVDRLLESPHYGETWARHWLDIVRYAESNGFERDSEKDFIWRYRDYVINAFNADLPYDQFIREQLAGDELDVVTPRSLIATGYHRLMQWDDEPADRPQHVYDVLDDNVRVTSEGFLGMTLGCARCHDHKGDPISQKDYYSFMAFFHGVTPMDKTRVIESIDVALPSAEQEAREKVWNERRQDVIQKLVSLETKAKAKLAKLVPGEEFAGTTAAEPVLIPLSREQPQDWHYTTKDPGNGWSEVGYRPKDWKRGLAPFGRHPDAKTAWRTEAIWLQKTFGLTTLPSGLTLTIQHDEDVEVYLNGQQVFAATGFVNEDLRVNLEKEAVAALQTGRNVVAVHVKQTVGGQYIDLGLEASYGGDRLAKLIEEHANEIFPENEVHRYRDLKHQLERLSRERAEFGLRAMIVQEHGTTAEPMFVHRRGSVHAPGDEVPPAFPSIFGGEVPKIPVPDAYAKSTGRRRVLADWIASPDNPRTSRVMVNRLWQHHFGRGICPTTSDFGFLGEEASHPELLDWLACEFVEKGWSQKEMHRLIMSSRTYQMASAGNAVALRTDPQNRWFWRVDMRRLSAEEIRDGMLAVTGRLNPKMGGPSFFPTLPAEVLATSSTGASKWGQSTEDEEARRSVYITIKRSLKPPELTDFDFADTDSPCSERFVTTVPIQALGMLNSEVVNKNAARLAERLRREAPGEVKAQVALALQLVTCRPAKEQEITHCLAMIETFKTQHQLSSEAALERFCLLALNLNEFVYLD